MKELILVRHAKSDWGSEFLKDIDRPLNERGYSDAYSLSEWYLKMHELPQLIVSSTATRALSTALIFCRTFDYKQDKFLLNDKIYESNVDKFLSVIQNQDNNIKSMMMFGHNPTITSLANEITNDFFIDNIPTCGIIAIRFKCDKWADVGTQNGEVIFHKFPKDFRDNS